MSWLQLLLVSLMVTESSSRGKYCLRKLYTVNKVERERDGEGEREKERIIISFQGPRKAHIERAERDRQSTRDFQLIMDRC